MGKFSFKNKNERPWPNERLGLAAIIGAITPSTVRIWVRADTSNKLVLLVFDRKATPNGIPLGEQFEELRIQEKVAAEGLEQFGKRYEISTDSATDTTKVVEVADLQPDTKYSYAIWSSTEEAFVLGHDKRRRFRTPAEKGDFAFGLFSCHNPYEFDDAGSLGLKIGSSKVAKLQNMRLWDMARMAFSDRKTKSQSRQVDFAIAGGDQAYCDGCDAFNIWKYLEKILKKRKLGDDPNTIPEQEDMVSWYREMYRGYWGHLSIKALFSQFPTYMIWDDHEIRDGWGSFKLKNGEEMKRVLFSGWEDHLNPEEAQEVIQRMFAAAKQVYFEYQHSHNPKTVEGVFDYGFMHKQSAFYVLDGRGHRNFDRDSYKILGKEQMERFKEWLQRPETKKAKSLCVVSAVPLVHTESWANRAGGLIAPSLKDDLRDAWEHKAHQNERRELVDLLFQQAQSRPVCVLSGDVHVSAAFKLQRGDAVLYQLTSSAITYNLSKFKKISLRAVIADDGTIDEGKHEFKFERMCYLTEPSFAIIKVQSKERSVPKVTFQLYQEQWHDNAGENGGAGKAGGKIPAYNSVVKLELDFGKPDNE